jgi:hypothetical protein
MAYGQIDPARLDGDALRTWYLRSPADIEDERRRAADVRYDAFFRPAEGPSEDQATSTDGDDSVSPAPDGVLWSQVADNRWRGERMPSGGFAALGASGSGAGTAASAKLGTCISCHGYVPPTPPIPPPFGPFPWPIGPFPAFRDLPGGAPSAPERGDRKQCEMQENSDRGICAQQPTEDSKAVCYSRIALRKEHCNDTGIIGEPSLFTAYRKNGRRWP